MLNIAGVSRAGEKKKRFLLFFSNSVPIFFHSLLNGDELLLLSVQY